MKHGSLTLCIALSALFAGANSFADKNIPKCVNETARFDGTGPLTYADIVGPAGTHVSLSRRYPQLCQQDEKACTGNAYVMPGDTVAVANHCGDFAQVQFIGTKTITVGWLRASALGQSLRKPPESAALFSDLRTAGHPFSNHFRLTRGVGLPVCEAYLQRLNRIPFDYMNQPYCNRPEDDSVPGFSKLVRVPLSPSEVNRLYRVAYNFQFPPNQAEADGIRAYRFGQVDMTKYVGNGLMAWRYDPPIDLNNDGVPDNIIVWHGVDHGGYIGGCGIDGRRNAQLPLVFKYGDEEIDSKATKAIVAHPVQKYDPTLNTGNLYGSATNFRPIARSIGVFKYRDKYYFDGFFDIWGDAKNERRGRPALANTMAVFLNQDGISRQICEYHLSGEDYPRP